MSKVLVLYGSSHGRTRAIAARIAQQLGDADLVDADAAKPVAPVAYAAVVIGSRIQYERCASSVVGYVAEYRAALARRVTAFFTVSMAATRHAQGADCDPRGNMASLFARLGWTPGLRAGFAGGLPYLDYAWPLRLAMRATSLVGGHPTDPSRNHVFTDELAVDAFAARIAEATR
ncbi:MAG TPA: flavodoxin domain-containing protein [Kofleriaceae bacterium]